MGSGTAHVHAHQLRRNKEPGVFLIDQPFDGVDAVACPDPVGVAKDSHVHARAARGTGLDLQPGVALLQLGHESVDRLDGGMHDGGTAGCVAGLQQVAVVVPLDIGDVVGSKHIINAGQDVVVGFGDPQVEDLLLSRGYRQRVSLAQAVLHEPELLVLDEPSNGLDPRQIIELRGLLRHLAQDCAVLVTSHILTEIERTADRAAILLDGRLLTVEKITRETATAPVPSRLEALFLELTQAKAIS